MVDTRCHGTGYLIAHIHSWNVASGTGKSGEMTLESKEVGGLVGEYSEGWKVT